MNENVISVWEKACGFDPTLNLSAQDIPALLRKRVRAIPYSRVRLFSRMAEGQISLFQNLLVPIRSNSSANTPHLLLDGIYNSFSPSRRTIVQAGPSSRRCKVRVRELVQRWKRERAIISVTDLHFRYTPFERMVDISCLSDFNILCSDRKFGPELIHKLEMMTLVLSSKGNITDNHTDDCDGSNHCFVGKKLWLAWDRMEGLARGFEDVDRDVVYGHARFNIKDFIAMPSARWFIVDQNKTLFLPGNLTHKVITLEPYIGLGSFHVALPSYVRSLRRWILYDSHDVVPKKLLGKINEAVIRRISALLRKTSAQEHWGLGYLKKSIALWDKFEGAETQELLMQNPLFQQFYRAAEKAITRS